MLFPVEEFICRFCEQPLAAGATVCHSCGSMLEFATDIVAHHPPPPDPSPHCPNCQVTLTPISGVCPSCGSLLE